MSPPAEPRRRVTAYYGQSAEAEYVFARDASGRTYLRRQFAPYPFHICRPGYVESDPPGMATLYVQSCSAGLLQHDDLHSTVVVEEGAQIHLTTGAPTIVHSMDESQARQAVRIEAFPGSLAEYLPEPLILFPRSRLNSVLHVTAHEGSTVVCGESFLLHDYAGGAGVFDWFEGELRIARPGGNLLARDHFQLHGDVFDRGLPGVNGEYRAHGALVVVGGERPAADVVDALCEALWQVDGVYAGASLLRRTCGAWMRVLASDGLALWNAMIGAWTAVREVLTGRTPTPRRK